MPTIDFNPTIYGLDNAQDVRQLFVDIWAWLIDHQEEGELRLEYEGIGNDWTKKDDEE
jgi:hypothetical protein